MQQTKHNNITLKEVEALQQKLDNKTKVLHEYFKEFGNEAKCREIEVIKSQTDKYQIVIVGNISAGKSTFINALLGKRMLPTDGLATTDCATFIHLSQVEKRAEITFADEKPKVVLNLEYDDNNPIKEFQKYNGSKEEEDKYNNVNEIHLYYPFMEELDLNYDVVLVDTPGPNNTDEHASKHKQQVMTALQDANLAIFLFDFGQLSTNLKATDENDKQTDKNLWDTLKDKKDGDEDFEVFFALNKIDQRFEDDKNKEGSSTEFYNRVKKDYMCNGNINFKPMIQDALTTLNKAIKENKLEPSEENIFPLASRWFLDYIVAKCEDDKQDCLRHFEKICHGTSITAESLFYEYCGIEALQKAIKKHLNTTAKYKLLNNKLSKIKEIESDETNRLETTTQTLNKPKEEAQKKLSKASQYLKKEMEHKKKSLETDIKSYCKTYSENIEGTIKTQLDKRVSAIEIVRKAFLFVKFYGEHGNRHKAQKQSEEAYMDYNFKGAIDKKGKELKEKDRIEEIKGTILDSEEQAFELFESYQNTLIENAFIKYTNSRINIKTILNDFNRACINCLKNLKDEIEKECAKELDINIQHDNIQEEEQLSMPSIQIQVPLSTLQTEWETHGNIVTKPFKSAIRWLSNKKFFNEKGKDRRLTVRFDLHKMIKELEGCLKQYKDEYGRQDIENCKTILQDKEREHIQSFNRFLIQKQQELDDLHNQLQEKEEELNKAKKQQEEFKKLLNKFREYAPSIDNPRYNT